MTSPTLTKVFIPGLIGAAIGGVLGYYAFFWIARQGFYALAVPPALLGLGAGICARGRSVPLALICAVAGLLLGLYSEWRIRPWAADESLQYFIGNLHRLQPVTWLMLALGVYLSIRLSLRRA